MITGFDGTNRISKLYTNSGLNFNEVIGSPFIGVKSGSVAFSDVNGDGKPDVLITGTSLSGRVAKLYTNSGTNFGEVIATPFIGVDISSIAFSDVNGDGKPDVLITGRDANDTPLADLYINYKISQTITGFNPIPPQILGNPPLTLSNIAATSGLPVSLTSSNPTVASVSGSTITFLAVGTTTITAMQGGNATWGAATPVSQVLTVTNSIGEAVFSSVCTTTGWSVYDPTTIPGWRCGSSGMNANAFISGASTVPGTLSWLISPPFDLSAYPTVYLSFTSRTQYSDPLTPYPQIRVKYSTNYTTGDPSLATWTSITGFTFSPLYSIKIPFQEICQLLALTSPM